MDRVLLFDVNETLLDLGALDPLFERMFGESGVRRQWFGLLLRNALTLTIIGEHQDFVSVGAASLQMVAEQHQVSLTSDDLTGVALAMTNLPAHDDVAPSLERLAGAGFRMAALTNSPQEAAESQLSGAGIARYFEQIMSVSSTARFKPAREVYLMAATNLGVEPSAMTMVAAHDWDVVGAMSVGCRGAYVMRPGMVRNPLYPDPDITGAGLDRVTDLLIEQSPVGR